MDVVGYTMSKICADQVFKDAGFAEGKGRDQVGVVELHDCFAANEVWFTVALEGGICECLTLVDHLSCFGTLRDRRGAHVC
jgi:sterol carrier protein 2